ncbi:mannosyltransferase family protein [Angustibacter luteus]|uniref:Mannosyltransferase family protein n=1 Tax=Angustibacter luteus TaxID=658456 RepID=A0ABW1JHB2_9ACTN
MPIAREHRQRTWARTAGWWCASRVALVALVIGVSWAQGVDDGLRARDLSRWLTERVTWWDSWHFVRIAEVGYLPPGLPCCDQAFFPGYPLLMAALAPVLAGSVVLAGLVVSLVSGGVAAVLLQRIGDLRAPGSGTWAVVFLAVAPFGIFLSSVYTESLFLALSLAAWLAAVRRHWWWAGAAAGAASLVRVNGLFLVAALAVTYLLQLRADGRRWPRPDAAALLLGPLAVLGYVGYLAARTGHLDAWQQAQDKGWVRGTAWPWQGLAAGWRAARTAPATDLVVSRWADLVVVVGGLLLLGVLLWLRRWAEAVLIGLNVSVLVCSTMLTSAARYGLLWFPAYLLLAEVSQREGWRWLRWAVPVVCVPALVALSVAFSAHYWVA